MILREIAKDGFAVIDTETTGLDPATDRIVEVGVVVTQPGLDVARYSWLIDPGIPIPDITTEITGITQVALWGDVRIFQAGARGQYAYPTGVYAYPGCTCEYCGVALAVAEEYGVPIIPATFGITEAKSWNWAVVSSMVMSLAAVCFYAARAVVERFDLHAMVGSIIFLVVSLFLSIGLRRTETVTHITQEVVRESRRLH